MKLNCDQTDFNNVMARRLAQTHTVPKLPVVVSINSSSMSPFLRITDAGPPAFSRPGEAEREMESNFRFKGDTGPCVSPPFPK